MSKFGYSLRPKLDPEDVTPVEAVLYASEQEEVGDVVLL